MAGTNRINFTGLCGSFAGSSLLLGGIIGGLGVWPTPRMPGGEVRPLVVELIPLRGTDHAEARFAPEPAGRHNVEPPRPAAQSPGPVAAGAVSKAVIAGSAVAAAASSGAERELAQQLSQARARSMLIDYQRQLNELIARNSRYPVEARRLRLAGVTLLAFRLDHNGQVIDSWIQQSSGSEALDAAALDALERAQPLPPMPIELPDTMDFVVEIDSSIALALAGR